MCGGSNFSPNTEMVVITLALNSSMDRWPCQDVAHCKGVVVRASGGMKMQSRQAPKPNSTFSLFPGS